MALNKVFSSVSCFDFMIFFDFFSVLKDLFSSNCWKEEYFLKTVLEYCFYFIFCPLRIALNRLLEIKIIK